MARLVYVDRNGRERSVSLGVDSPTVTVGRNPDCLIQTAKPSVSRRHSDFTYSGGTFEVADLGSSNGTFINGREIRRQTLRDRDEIKCGDFVIRFFLDDEEGAPKSHSGYDRPSTPLSASYEPSQTQMPGDSGSYPMRQGAPPITPRSSSAHQSPPPPPVAHASGNYNRSSAPPPPPLTQGSAGRGNDEGELQKLRRDYQALQEQIADQEAIIAVMRDESGGDAVQSELARSKKVAEALQEELKKAKIEAEEAKLELDTKTDACADLTRAVDQKQLMIESYQERYERLKEQAEGQIAQLDDYRSELQAKTEAVEDLERRIADQDKAADKTTAQLAEYIDETSDLKVRVNQLERQLEEAQRNTKLTDFELKKVRQEADNLRSMIDSEGSENAGLQDNLNRLRQVLEAKETEIIANERRIEELEGELEPYRAGEVGAGEIDALNTKIETQSETIDNLQSEVKELQVQLKDARSRPTAAGGGDPEELERAHEELERAKRRCRRLELKVDQLQTEVDSGDGGASQAKIDELKKQNREQRQRIKELEQAEGDAASGTSSGSTLDVGRMRELIGELKDLRSQNVDLKTDLDMVRLEQATGGGDGTNNAEIQRLRAEVAQLTLANDSNENLAQTVARLKQERDELSDELERARAAADSTRDATDDELEDQLEDLRRQNAALKDDVENLIAESRTRGVGAPPGAEHALRSELEHAFRGAEADADDELGPLRAENERLKDQLRQRPLPEDLEDLKDRNARLSRALEDAGDRDELEDLRAHNTKLTETVARLERDLDAVAATGRDAAINDAEGRAQELETRVRELEAEIGDLRASRSDTNLDGGKLEELQRDDGQLHKDLEESRVRVTSSSELEPAGDDLVAALNDNVSQLRNNFKLMVDYVADIEKVYDALKRADLSQLSTLDRVRIEKTIREAEPDITFEELGNMLGDCVSSSEEMKSSLLKFKREASS